MSQCKKLVFQTHLKCSAILSSERKRASGRAELIARVEAVRFLSVKGHFRIRDFSGMLRNDNVFRANRNFVTSRDARFYNKISCEMRN